MRSIRSSNPWAIARFGLVLVTICTTACGDELIHFKSGFDLSAESHVILGSVIEVRVGSGSLEFPAGDILTIETVSTTRKAAEIAGETSNALTPDEMILQIAQQQGVDASFVRSVARIESGLLQASISPKGALGLMQLMPQTAKELGVNPLDANENVRGGVQYLRNLLIRYNGDSALALAAYNAGPGAVQKFKGIPPYMETQHYVRSVLKEYSRQLAAQKATISQSTKRANAPSRPSATN